MAGLSRWPGEGRYPQNINWSLGFLRDRFVDPSTYNKSLGPCIQTHGFSYHCYADNTQLYLSFRPDDPTVAARISGCLADISAWVKEHHLQLNLAKTYFKRVYLRTNVPGYVCNPGSPRERDAASRRYGERDVHAAILANPCLVCGMHSYGKGKDKPGVARRARS